MPTTDLERLVFEMDVNLKKLDAKLSKSDSDIDKFARKQQAVWNKMGVSIGDDIGSAVGGAAGRVPLLGNALSGLAGPAAIATGALALLAIGLNKAREAMDWADEIQRASKLSNAGSEEFQKWAISAQTVGIEQDKLADILKDVNDRVGDFLTTGGGPMADFFTKIAPKIGVTAEQFRNLSGPQALQLYVSSLEKAGVNQQEMTFFMEAMASDATALIPLLKNNGQAMTDLGSAAEKTGQILSDATVKELSEMNREVKIAQDRLDNGLKRAFLGLSPAIVGSTEAMADFVGWLNKAVTGYGKFLDAKRSDAALRLEARRKGIVTREGQDEYVRENQSLDWEGAAGGTRRRQSKAPPIYVNQLPPPPPSPTSKVGGKAENTKANPTIGMADAATRGAANGEIDWAFSSEGFRKSNKDVELYEAGLEKVGLVLDGLPEKFDGISETADPLRDQLIGIGNEVAASLGEAAVYGDDLGDALSRTFKRIAADWATQGLENIFHTLLSGGKGGGGGVGGVVSGLFSIFSGGGIGGGLSGARANGGPVSGGKSYLVGERGPEIFTPGSNGGIATNGQLEGLLNAARGSRSGGVTQVLKFDLRGGVVTDDLLAQMNVMARQAAMQGAAGGAGLARLNAVRRDRNRLG